MALSAKTVTPIFSGLFGVALLTMMSGLVKAISPTVSRPQLLLSIFSLMAIVLLLLVVLKRLALPRLADFQNEIIPAGLLLATSACLVVALGKSPITLVIGLFCMTPMIVAGLELAAGRRRIDTFSAIALIVGGVGAVIIVISAAKIWTPPFIASLLAPMIAAVGMVLSNGSMDRSQNAAKALFTRLILATAAAVPLLSLGTWHTPDAVNAFAFSMIGLFGVGGYLCVRTSAAILPPVQTGFIHQTAALWAALIGLITFGEIQPLAFWFGTTLVVCGAVAVCSRSAPPPA